MRKNKDKLGLCGKVCFEGEAEANSRVNYLALIKPFTHGKPMRVYRCGGCRAYHVTSRFVPGQKSVPTEWRPV